MNQPAHHKTEVLNADPIAHPKKRLPAEEGVWMFVLGDLVVFALFFSTYLFYRAESVVAYTSAQATLNLTVGTVNTLLLLTSSSLLAQAVKAIRIGSAKSARPLVLSSILFGLAFVAGKTFEYVQKAYSGIDENQSEFFMFYFIFTGIHYVHVMIGIVLLVFVIYSNQSNHPSKQRLAFIEGTAIYWHMVDLLWIILFTLFYLIP